MARHLRTLRLRSGFLSIPTKDGVYLRSLSRNLLLRGETARLLLPRLLELLDGSRTIAELATSLDAPDQVESMVALLDQAGLLEPSSDDLREWAPLVALLDGLGVDAHQALSRLQSSRVGALVSAPLTGSTESYLRSFGLGEVTIVSDPYAGDEAVDLSQSSSFGNRLVAAIEQSNVFMVCLDRWQPPLMDLVNQVCCDLGRPWIAIQPQSEMAFLIGPFVVPGQTACYACWQRRRWANRLEGSEVEAAIDNWVEIAPRGATFLSRSVRPIYEAAVALGVMEIVKFAAGLELYLTTLNKVVTFTPFLLEAGSAPVLKLPRCPTCSRTEHVPPPRVWMGGDHED